MRPWFAVILIGLVLALPVVSLAQQAKPLEEGQKVEVREGDTWSAATIVKKEGRRYQIRYEGGTEEEWVNADRLRPAQAGGAAPAPAPAAGAKPAAKPAPKVADWKTGEKVEAKWGGQYRKAVVINRRGEWYLINYEPGPFREWVEHWRIRKVGDTDDPIGYAKPNGTWKAGDNPPRESAGEPPAPTGAGARTEEQRKAMEQFKADPAFKEANATDAKDLALQGAGGDLKITPDAAKVPGPARPINLAGASNEFFETMKDLVIARGGNFAAVIHENAPPGKEAQSKLERIDLAGGKSAGVFPLSSKMVLFDVSMDGKLVALRNDEFGFGASTRLEVCSLDGNQVKKLLILFPYEKESWAPDRDISAAWLLDNANLLTMNPKGKLVLWDVTTGKALYKAQINGTGKPALSANGKQMAMEVGKAIVIVEPLTGMVLGSLPLEGKSGLNLSFSPSGRQLAGLGSGNIYAWDLTTGQMFREFTVAAGSGEFAMVADGYAMLRHSTLLDFERRIPLWHYQAGGRSAGEVSPSGVLWYSVKGSGQPGPLTPLKVPTADALALAKTLKADD